MPPDFFGVHHLYLGLILIPIGFILRFRGKYLEKKWLEWTGIIMSGLGTGIVIDDQVAHFFNVQTPIRVLTDLIAINLPWMNKVWAFFDKLLGKKETK